jgi:hypothetical protein
MGETKYGDLVRKLPFQRGPGGANAKQIIQMSGEDLEGLDLNFSLGLFDQPGQLNPGKGAHVHPYDECLVFFGNKTDDLSYLGAERTIEIGEEHEKHSFDVPTAVSIPKGLPHFPVVCHKVDKPYGVIKIGLGATYEISWIN